MNVRRGVVIKKPLSRSLIILFHLHLCTCIAYVPSWGLCRLVDRLR